MIVSSTNVSLRSQNILLLALLAYSAYIIIRHCLITVIQLCILLTHALNYPIKPHYHIPSPPPSLRRCSSSRTATPSPPALTTPPAGCSTSAPTRSWPCTRTTTSSAASPVWPSASPAGCCSLAMTTSTVTSGMPCARTGPVSWRKGEGREGMEWELVGNGTSVV